MSNEPIEPTSDDAAPHAMPVERGKPFPIAGLGASAGGLQALRGFFSQLPPDTGIAFVVVSHQHAGQQSLLPELLRGSTKMRVEEAAEGMEVLPDCVYVAPPGQDVALERGALRLIAKRSAHGPPLPIDTFLRSLARDAEDRAVAIILSGTGTDGTLGAQAVKGAAGLVLVQDEGSAEFSGMPTSALATGLVDFVGPPGEMPAPLLAWARSPYLHGPRRSEAEPTEAAREEFARILRRLRARTGRDFSGYKPATLLRRIERRRNLQQVESLSGYVELLENDEQEVHALFQDLLIGVTAFFRDPDAFQALDAPLTELLTSRPDHSIVRGWVAGCSTGEEAYSCAILLRECLERLGKPLEVQIFATDLDARAIEIARQGRYPVGIAADVSPQRLAHFFVEEAGGYQVRKEIREMLVFATQDVLGDPPFTRVDLVSCRNLLIYLGADRQRWVLRLLHYALNPDGLLLLGNSEATTVVEELFAPVDRRWKLYRRRQTAGGPIATLPSYRRSVVPPRIVTPRGNASEEASPLLARTFAPPSVLVNDRGEVVHVHGRTGSFLEPAEGRASPMNVLEMAREGLRPALTSLLREAALGPARRDVRIVASGEERVVSVVARRIAPPDPFAGLVLVSFEDPVLAHGPATDAGSGGAAPVAAIAPMATSAPATELEQARRDLQATVEELQTSNEELASSNEEVQATNEELQSANEELETSREELQSLNEELQTVNAELRAKVEELSQASDDVENLLNSTSVATLFLDRKLCIKRFTADIVDIVRVQASDVGRPIADLRMRVDGPNPADDAEQVLRTLDPVEREIHSEDGANSYLMRAHAYRTRQNVIEGVVVTFVDITRQKELEAADLARVHAQAIVETVRQPLLTLEADLRVHSANQAFCRLFQTAPDAVEGREIFALPNVRWDVARLRALLLEVIPRDAFVRDYELTCDLPEGGRRTLLVDARRMRVEGDRPTLILLALSDGDRGDADV